MTGPNAAEVFAKLLRSFEPYGPDIVLIGGWVHALYLAEANRALDATASGYAVQTYDIDFTLPAKLPPAGRRSLIELAEIAGFRPDLSTLFTDDDRCPDLYHPLLDGVVDLDFMTRATRTDEDVYIEGQPRLVAHGYPDLNILTENTMVLLVGSDIHPLLDPTVRVTVPTLAAYVMQKGLASIRRTSIQKSAKDIVYMFEILRHPTLGPLTRKDITALSHRYAHEFTGLANAFSRIQVHTSVVVEAVNQVVEGNRAQATRADIAAQIVGQLRRLIALGDSASRPT